MILEMDSMLPALHVVVREGWLDRDGAAKSLDGVNARMGWGRGLAGRLAARRWLDRNKESLIGLYADGKPRGWVSVENLPVDGARVEFFFPKATRETVALMSMVIERLFKQGVFRIESPVSTANYVTKEHLIRRLGFWKEGKLWARRMDPNGGYRDVYSLVLTRPKWQKFKETHHGMASGDRCRSRQSAQQAL